MSAQENRAHELGRLVAALATRHYLPVPTMSEWPGRNGHVLRLNQAQAWSAPTWVRHLRAAQVALGPGTAYIRNYPSVAVWTSRRVELVACCRTAEEACARASQAALAGDPS